MKKPIELKKIYIPPSDSHKGQNGRLLIIGGSHFFHAASLWALQVASRIVDLVHYSSVPENNAIVKKLKTEFRNGIVVPREEIESYIEEDDCILIGPGMVRTNQISKLKSQNSKLPLKFQSLRAILEIQDEGIQTYFITKYLLTKYKDKKWVIDAGALQMTEPEWIPKKAILTPHHREFEQIYLKSQISKLKTTTQNLNLEKITQIFAKKYDCFILLKGEKDIVVSSDQSKTVEGGHAGMTKGGTGDVLAGLVAALYCKNDPWTAAVSASYINKKAGEDLSKKMGYWYNASDLADQIPETMKRLLL